MSDRFRSTSIRTRLVAQVGLLLAGFVVLTSIAGGQIAQAARADYEQRLLNEVQLIRQGLTASFSANDQNANPESEAFTRLIREYEAQLNGIITIYSLTNDRNSPQSSRNNSFRDAPEMETAIRNEIVVVERKDEQGRPSLYTAASFGSSSRDGFGGNLVQLRVPLDNLTAIILQRWMLLVVVFAGVLVVTTVSALAIARSIIRPLDSLQAAAVQISRGDLSYRVAGEGSDEIGQVAQAFNQMAAQVQSMVEEQRAYASNASHELRTPLTTIRLRSEALRYEEGLEPAFTSQYIREIDDEAQRMSSLIDDLTLLSRFDAGRAERGHDEIDMKIFANSLYQRFKPQMEAQNLHFVLELPEQLTPVTVGLNHLTIVFRNLIENALKYTPSGGTITWRMREDQHGVTHILQDTGQGVEQDQLPHVFERFYRADKARSRDIPGHGLGLAIVKSIVDVYGGAISISSEGRDRGTTVTLTLPNATSNM